MFICFIVDFFFLKGCQRDAIFELYTGLVLFVALMTRKICARHVVFSRPDVLLSLLSYRFPVPRLIRPVARRSVNDFNARENDTEMEQ